MKKSFLISFGLVLMLAACKKDNQVSTYVKFNSDAGDRNYTEHTFAHWDSSGGSVFLTILGANNESSFNDYIGFYIDNSPSDLPIGTGQYEDNSSNYIILATHANGPAEYEAGESVAADAVTYGITIPQHFKVIITSMDSEMVTGTFSGNFYKNGDIRTGTRINITNGEFRVRFED